MNKDELRNLQIDTAVLNRDIINYVKDVIQTMKDNYCLSDDDISTIIGLDKEHYLTLMSKGFEGEISSGLIATLYLLRNGNFSIQNIQNRLDRKLYNYTDFLTNYRKRSKDELVNELLKLLEINSDDELKQAVELGAKLKSELKDINWLW